nr:MAG TPA: hypothetical protein [Caudoviricetes sp.]
MRCRSFRGRSDRIALFAVAFCFYFRIGFGCQLVYQLLHSVIDARLDLPCGNRSCFRDGFQQFFIRRFIVWIHQNRHLSMQL